MTAVQVSQLLLHPVWYHWWSKDCSHCHRTGCLLMSYPYMASCKSILPAILLSGQVLLHSSMVSGSSVDHARSVAFWWFPHPFFLSTAGVFGDDLIIAVAWAAWRFHPLNTLHLGFVSITVDSQCGGFLRVFFREFTPPYIWGNDPILLYTTMFQMGGTKTPPGNRIP